MMEHLEAVLVEGLRVCSGGQVFDFLRKEREREYLPCM